MAVTVRIPGVLRAEAGGHSVVECSTGDGATLGSVLDDMAATWPLLERRIRDERGELRRYVNVYVDGEECRRMEGLGTPVTDRTEILVIPSVAGGRA